MGEEGSRTRDYGINLDSNTFVHLRAQTNTPTQNVSNTVFRKFYHMQKIFLIMIIILLAVVFFLFL